MAGPEDKRRADDPKRVGSVDKDAERRAKEFQAKSPPGKGIPDKFNTLKKTDGLPKKRFT